MRFWISFHDYDRLGYLPGGVVPRHFPRSFPFYEGGWDYNGWEIVTRRSVVQDATGDIAFSIVGAHPHGMSTPREFILWSWIRIAEVSQDNHGFFHAAGPGRVLDWLFGLRGAEFDAFRRVCGDFQLGFFEITASSFLPRLIEQATLDGGLSLEQADTREPT